MADVNPIANITPAILPTRDLLKKVKDPNKDKQHKDQGNSKDEAEKDDRDESSGHVDEYV